MLCGHIFKSVDGERNEFLLGPAWRTRARPAALWAAVAVTFGIVLLAGGVVLWLALALLGSIGADDGFVVIVWLGLTLAVLAWALRTSTPAMASDYEDQAWSEYAVRAVMIGREQRRQRAARVITAVLFGAPLAVGVPLLFLLAVIGVS